MKGMDNAILPTIWRKKGWILDFTWQENESIENWIHGVV
jgi:hypothetical protein